MIMDVPQAAQHLKLPQKTVQLLARRGELPAAKLGRQWRFVKDELDGWVRNLSQENLRQDKKEKGGAWQSISVRVPRTGKFGSNSLESKLDDQLRQRTSSPHRSWRKSSTTISGGKSDSERSGSPGMTP